MKILAVRIKNLASLEGITEIDFTAEPLCSAGIFAITGATGAGKSTILDAICLALYSKTPRYLQARESGVEIQDVQGSSMSQGDVRSILRDGTADGFAEVDFVGTDKEYYRATWSVRRARNRIEGSMQSDNLLLKNITSNLDIPGRKTELLKEIERLVGLNFEQFTRSVLLAQGDFTAFMKANKDEKSSLLEKLTGTHIYSEISKKIYENFRSEEFLMRDLNTKKEGIITLSDEEIEVVKQQQKVVQEQIKKQEGEIDRLKAEILWHNQNVEFAKNIDVATTNLQAASELQLQSKPRKNRLQLIEHAQSTRSSFDAFTLAQKNKLERENTLALVQNAIFESTKHKIAVAENLEKLEISLKQKSANLTAATPLLIQARDLDILIREKQKQVQNANSDFQDCAKKKEGQQTSLGCEIAKLEVFQIEIEKLKSWIRENENRQQIAEDSQIIISKLRDAQKNAQLKFNSENQCKAFEDEIKLSESNRETFSKSFDIHAKNFQELQKKFDEEKKALLLFPIEEVQLQKDDVEKSFQNTLEARSTWQTLFALLNECESAQNKLKSTQSDFARNQVELKKTAELLVIQTAEKDASAKMLQQAKLSATKSVEEFRTTLIDGEPCPVCGSENHPYAIHNPALNNLINDLEKAHSEVELTYSNTFRTHSSLEQQCELAGKAIALLESELYEKNQQTDFKNKLWLATEPRESRDISNETKLDWFDQKLTLLKTEQQKLKDQINNHFEQNKKLEHTKFEVDKAKELRDSSANEIKNCDSELAVLKEKWGGASKETQSLNSEIAIVKDWLQPYFKTDSWFQKWELEPDSFVSKIDVFANEWKTKTKKLEEVSKENELLGNSVNQLKKQLQQITEDYQLKFELQKKTTLDCSQLQQQRALLFEGQDVEVVQTRLKKELDDVQAQIEESKNTHTQLEIDFAKKETEKLQLESELVRIESELRKNLDLVQNWITDYNQIHDELVTIEILSELLAISQESISAEKRELQAVDDRVLSLLSALSEHKAILENHQLKKISSQELSVIDATLLELKNTYEEQKKVDNEATFQLNQDAVNKERIGGLLLQIEKQSQITENWSKLNEIIGSSDGKKFRQIAQEYTLDTLLSFANVHLSDLTPRYKIERIPTTLALQIIDQDMGDEMRTVYSLSGGESFLVSLALALGLASLSSNRMKVESLFIDEGFGSLDPNTLNIAMDALERLHNQGRKVGVISHVQEMTERIPVQIRVSKMANGRSKVEVLG